jgi:hypothetical protein
VKDFAASVTGALKAAPLIALLLGGLVWLIDVRAGAAIGPVTQRVIILEEKIDSILDTLRRIESQQDETRSDVKELLKKR